MVKLAGVFITEAIGEACFFWAAAGTYNEVSTVCDTLQDTRAAVELAVRANAQALYRRGAAATAAATACVGSGRGRQIKLF